MTDDKKLPVLDDAELAEVSGGASPKKKFRCPKCNQITMVVRYKCFKCTNPACGYTHAM